MDLLFALAVFPAAVLLWYVWKMDPIEKEPPGLLMKLLLFGMLSTIPAILLEMLGTSLFGSPGSSGYGYGIDAIAVLALQNFVVVALVEEGCKFVFLKGPTWRSLEFDYVFDGIVYAVFVGLGFAITENINYVFNYGFATGVVRAFTAIPGHCVFAVFMGYFYGRAKYCQVWGHHGREGADLFLALAVPILCHGIYDTLAGIEGDLALVAFLAFLVAIVAIAMRLVKRASAKAVRIR